MYFDSQAIKVGHSNKHLTLWLTVRYLNPFSVVTRFEELLKITAQNWPPSL